ncbi:EAL domain-containing response regulator [Pseudomonas citronellolis]|jgi:EAL domain-containing protein (putative c-di-GMP-specific phosphodiesterase class I)/FixJ family two-component response regulator|uniref:EAL domain-containing response regulator n=1 Tax=Pseudomonas citronellolis TaxID=53408 RepID=UPI003C2FE04F
MESYRILVVEDQPFQREYLLSLFREHGVRHLVGAGDGAAALGWLEREEFDLVLCDLMMPGMDGVQMIQRLSRLEHRPQLALMSSTSRRMMVSASLVAQSLGLSVLDVLPKPAMPSTIGRLLVRLGKCLRQGVEPDAGASRYSREVLCQALDAGELQAWFQAKKSLHSGRIVGAEALVRWVSPQQAMRLPGCFMTDIEAHGLQEPLLWSMLEQTLRAQALWRELGYEVPVSVNLPTHLLDAPDLPDRLGEFVGVRGACPGSLSLELSESSTTSLPANYYAGACRLRMKGFGLAQDDFGQGYSSLYNLVSTPFSELKIDRSLVHGCVEDRDLAAALASSIELGRQMGLEVVAEGVETWEELSLLRRLGCDRVQGFLISRAVSAQAFLEQLQGDGPGTAV